MDDVRPEKAEKLNMVSAVSERVFDRPVMAIHPVRDGQALLGKAVFQRTPLFTSPDVPPLSHKTKELGPLPRAGAAAWPGAGPMTIRPGPSAGGAMLSR